MSGPETEKAYVYVPQAPDEDEPVMSGWVTEPNSEEDERDEEEC